MKFCLVDRVLELEPAKRIVAVKNVSLAEEYLQDHFPTFPVLPGVLMIEALVQSGAWLERVSTDFAHSVVVLDEVRNMRYGAFFRPGTSMRITVDCLKREDGLWRMKGTGAVDDQVTVQGRFVLKAFNLADDDPAMADTDRRLTESFRKQWEMVRPDGMAVEA